MNRLKEDKQIAILSMLVEGNSLRSIERMTGVHRDTIMRLMVKVGERCQVFMEAKMRNLECSRLELDEIWTFCGKKDRRKEGKEVNGIERGDQFVFYAIDPETKLIPAWHVGKRDKVNTFEFVKRVKASLNGVKPQVSTDAFAPYRVAIPWLFDYKVDYGTIVKQYGTEAVGLGRYAPPCVKGATRTAQWGHPQDKYICTSYIERHNLTIRTFMRRSTRLSLGFSKKLENLKAAVALHFAYYNFCWIPRTTRVTPAMEAGMANRPWSMRELYTRALAN